MKKDIYVIEAKRLVFFSKENQRVKMLVTKEKLIELLDSNYQIYSAVLVSEDDLDKYVNLGNILDVK